MRQQLRPSIESLEGKTLLSHMALGMIGHHGPIRVPIVTGPIVVSRPVGTGVPIVGTGVPIVIGTPVGAPVGAPASSLDVSLTTNHPTYTHGQMVRMTFTETNDTGHNVFVELGPSIDGFSVSRAGKTVWRSNAGFTSDVIVIKKLVPGAAINLTAAWSASSLTGTYVAHNQLDPHGASATFEIVRSPAVAAHAKRGG